MERAWEDYSKLREAGVPDEDARYVLPNAAKNNITITMNARELLHFFSIRCCTRAQWEIREYADAILELIRPLVPWTIEAWQDYSAYRNGLILTGFEVAQLRRVISEKQLPAGKIDVDNQLEQMEWKKKAKKLGFLAE